MKDMFNTLKEIYDGFDKEYFIHSENSCGDCKLCCTSVMKFPPLSHLECDFIEDFLKKHDGYADIKTFKNFMIHRDRERCPYFNHFKGCTIYTVRPMYCRLFGLFRFKGTNPVPQTCVFYGKTVKAPPQDMYKIIKYFPEFTELKYKYDFLIAGDDKEKLEALINLGKEYIRQDREEELLSLFEEGIKKFPCDYRVHFYAAIAFRCKNNLSVAAKELEESLLLGGEKEFPEIYGHLGFIYLDIMDTSPDLSETAKKELIEKAFALFTRSMELEAHTVTPHMGLAFVHNARGDKDRALEGFKKVLAIEHNHSLARKMVDFLSE
mgnify:CR=1 FL=1